jgi:putative N6-adenine-specific DNA methylase
MRSALVACRSMGRQLWLGCGWCDIVVREEPLRWIHIHPARDEPLKLPKSTTNTTTNMELLVTCLPGLEQTLSSELSRLGIAHKGTCQGARLLTPTPHALVQSYLLLGSASNILLRCGESFSARGLAELRRKTTTRVPWEKLLGSTQVRLNAKVTTTKSKLFHSAAIEGRVVAGIYEALGYTIPIDCETLEYPPTVSNEDPLVRLDVQIVRDQVTIWMYASETPLHRRGYRLETSKAPLREDLAYAMLYNGGWRSSSDDTRRSHDIILDPFCGSGTIAIEGAAMVAGLPPGRLRPPPWLGTSLENLPLHQELLHHALLPQTSAETTTMVFASDRDAGAIEATAANATRAGVLEYIEIEQCALTAHPLWSRGITSEQSLLVVTNPPFGKRVSKSSKIGKGVPPLLPLYQSLHHLASSRQNTSAIVLCQGMELMNRTGWKVDKVFQSTHGGLSVTAVKSRKGFED